MQQPLPWTISPWPHNLSQQASGNPGAVHFVELDVRQVHKCISPASAASIKAPNAAGTWRHGDSSMNDNERRTRITVHGAPHFAWVEVTANIVQ